MDKKKLSAQRGIEAACILFQLNSKRDDILAMARSAQMPKEYLHGEGAAVFCNEWRAFTHAVVTAGLMQYAPNSVLVGYLRQTSNLLAIDATPQPSDAEVTAFVDGPFVQYMPLLAHERQAECPELFCQRIADQTAQTNGGTLPNNHAKARLAAMMAMVISAINDKMEEYVFEAE